jgi:hypothetical protein
MSTTDISKIPSKSSQKHEYVLDEENLPKFIMDLSLPLELRLEALDKYFPNHPDDTVEIVNKLGTMYEISKTRIIRQYLFAICEKSQIDPLLLSIACQSLHLTDEKDELGYKAVDIVYPKLNSNIGTPYKIDFIKILMKNESYREKAKEYFCRIINDTTVSCQYRFKAILALESCTFDTLYFRHSAYFQFLIQKENETVHRILAGQNLLQNCKLETGERTVVEKQLLEFAEDEKLPVNRRADATDVLLQLGSDETKVLAKKIIMKLGSGNRTIHTVYESSQNVHNEEVEDSVKEALEYLQGFENMKHEGKFITFEFVEGKILALVEDEKMKDDIKVALNRITMDRALYSKYNCTLIHILLKIWTYISGHKDQKELEARLVQELCDMADTCSSGFVASLF